MAAVRFAFSGAAPLSVEVADAWHKRFGLPLRQGYGLTEASPVVTTSVMEQPARPTSIGVALPGVEVQLVDDDGDEALAGDPGEVWVRGPNVFPEVLAGPGRQPRPRSPLTAWLRTGDARGGGRRRRADAIVDRAKDLIIVSGFNVYPAEVEEVLAEHPDVADAAVVGDVDPYRGEVVHAYVVLKASAGSTTGSQLIEWCTRRLARYKCPAQVTLVDTLPHGLAGKLLQAVTPLSASASADASADDDAGCPAPTPATADTDADTGDTKLTGGPHRVAGPTKRSGAGGRRPPEATRNPAKITEMPTSSVTAKAVMAPNTELRVPLAPKIKVPPAMRTLDHTNRRSPPLRRTRHALQAAPPKMAMAPPADPTPASTRGRGPNTLDPWTNWSAGSGARNGAITTTPAANAHTRATPNAVTVPARRPASR